MHNIWHNSQADTPFVEVGDNIIMIVLEREGGKEKRVKPRIVLLEAAEDGWESVDNFYAGYNPSDSVVWAYEKDFCEQSLIASGIFNENYRMCQEYLKEQNRKE